MISQIIADDDTSRNDDGEFNEAYSKLMSNSTSDQSFGTLLLLGIPRESVISLDGAVRTVGREDFGVVGLQPNLFHFFSCRPSVVCGPTSNNVFNALAVGIVMMVTSNDVPNNENWIVARKYDKRIEELSADELYSSSKNLKEIITSGTLSWNHFFRYPDFVTLPLSAQQSNTEVADSWVHLVSYITPPLLKKRGIGHGDKIIPGAFTNDDRILEGSGQEVDEQLKKDGSLIVYPPIPCIDDEASFHVKKTSHIGTKNFLKTVSPQNRTLLLHYHQLTTGMTFTSVGGALLENVLNSYYEDEWKELVGDMQLSFLAFLYLGCLASFEHWRDLISMLSLSGAEQVSNHPELFSSVLDLLTYQLRFVEVDFFEEVDISSGNFFQPAIHKLLASCARCLNENNCDIISQPFKKIMETMKLRFGLCFKLGLEYGMDHSSAASAFNLCDSNDDEKYKEIALEKVECINQKSSPINCNYRFDQLLDDFEGEEGPAIVPYKDIEDFLDRSSLLTNQKHFSIEEDVRDRDVERAYPCLFAAKAGNPHEDIFMTCARILESASDVSLVREAAAYLQQMEKPFL